MMGNLLNCLILTFLFLGGIQLVGAQTEQAKLLETLIKVTSSTHPFRQDLPDWIKPQAPEPEKAAAKFDPVLAENTQLTAEQKQFIKGNYEKLALLLNDKLLVAMSKHVKFSDWLTAYLAETYPKELTPDEMQNWITYFESTEGESILKAILAFPQPTDPENQTLLQKFEKTPIGIKFIKIFGNDLDAYIQSKMSEKEAAVKEELEKTMTPAEINKLFEQFVSEKYKKP